MAADKAPAFTFEDLLQLIEGLEAGAASQPELLEYAIRLGQIADQASRLSDMSFETFARFMCRMAQSVLNPGSPGYAFGNASLRALFQTISSFMQTALHTLRHRDPRFSVLSLHIIRILTDRNANVYAAFDQRRLTESEYEGVALPPNHWTTHLKRNAFCNWVDPENNLQAVKILSFSHHRPTIEIEAQRFGMIVVEKSLPLMSPFLSSLDTAPTEPIEEWRNALTTGSKVDCIDHISKWYTAQIVGVQQQENLVHIAYDGWAPAYNEWLPRTSRRLAPYLSIAVGGRASAGVEIIYPEEWPIDGSKDRNDAYAVYRGQIMGGELLPLVINTFAEADGLVTLIERIETKPHSSLEEIRSVAFIVRQIAPLLSQPFADGYINDVSQALFSTILGLTDVELRLLNKEFLTEFVMVIRTPLLRIQPKAEIARFLDEFELNMALKRFRSPIVERQLNGMEFLHDTMHVCKNRDSYSRAARSGADCGWAAYRWQWLDSRSFIQWMDRNRVWEDAFGEHAHAQLMKRASDLLRFICTEAQMTKVHLDLIWAAIQRSMRWQDEATTQILYTVLDEIAFDLSDDHVAHLLDRVSSIDLSDYVVHTLDMIRRLHRDDSTALNLMWKAMQGGSPELSKEARIRLERMLQLPSPGAGLTRRSSTIMDKCETRDGNHLTNRIKFLVQGTQKIQEHTCVVQNMRLVQDIAMSLRENTSEAMSYRNMLVGNSPAKLFSAATNPTEKDEDYPPIHYSRSDIIAWLDTHCLLMKSVFSEFTNFIESAGAYIREKGLDPASDMFDHEDFQHSGCSFMENLRIRLGFLKFILSESSVCLTTENMDVLWNIMFEKAVTLKQKDLALEWLRESIADSERDSGTDPEILTNDAIHYVFVNRLCSLNPNQLSHAAYTCIECYFFRVNASSGKIAGQPYKVVSSDPDGIDFFWKILLDTPDMKVSASCITLLNQLYCGRRLDYIAGIMRRMATFIDDSDFMRIRRLLKLISRLMADCTESRFPNHGQLHPGCDNDNLMVSFRVTHTGLPPFTITQPSRTSLHWLRSTIASKIGADVYQVRMFLSGAELLLHLDDRSLGEICTSSRATSEFATPRKKRQKRQTHSAYGCMSYRNQQFHPLHLMVSLKRFATNDVNASRLLASNDTLTPTAYASVCQLFHTFSSKGSNVLSSQQLKNFLSVSSIAKILCPEGAGNLKAFLNEYGVETNGSSSFTLASCVALYTTAAANRPQLFWQDVAKLCSSQSMNKSEEDSGTAEDSEMVSPREILSSHPDYFATLFRALQLGDNRVSGQVWRLLMAIPTNPVLRCQILELESSSSAPESGEQPNPDWDSLFDKKSAFRLMYSLQIIQNVLSKCDLTEMDMDVMTGLFDESTDNEEDDAADGSDSASTSSKSSLAGYSAILAISADGKSSSEDLSLIHSTEWSADFIKAGGFRHLYNVFLSAPALDQNDDTSLFCLALLLKSVLSLARSAQKMISEAASESENTQSPLITGFSELFPWLHFGELHDRVLKIIYRISTANVTRTAWASTCVIHFALPLWGWTTSVAPDTLLQLLTSTQVLSTFHSALTCSVRAIREQIQSALYAVCQQNEKVHLVVLDYLLSLLNQVESAPSGQFFCLLKKLLLERFAYSPITPSTYESLVDRFVVALSAHKSVELPETLSSSIVDELLLGIIDILTVLCSSHETLCEKAGKAGAVEIILNQCLYGIGPPDLPKCRSVQTRRAAFSCVSLLCAHSHTNLGRALACLYPICSSSSHEQAEEACVRRGWEYEPEKVIRSSTGYTGLINQGTTCYMNALVSQLFMIPTLRDGLIQAVCCKDSPTSDAIRNHRVLLHQLQVMLANMAISACSAFDTSGFCSVYTDEAGVPIDVRVQQDAQEFFNVLVDRIELALKGSKSETLLKNVFGGRLCNQMLCQGGCGSIRERFEDFSNVSLQVKGFRNLSESLDAYVASEKLSGVDCDVCGTRTETTLKRVVLDDLPQTLIFHLKRFELNFETFMNEKLNSRFEFPSRVNMEPYTKHALTPQKAANTPATEPLEYELSGVIIHIGTADAGHYFSYVKDRSAPANVWLEFNDQIVRRFSVEKLGEEAFGGDDNMKNAYMLVYERVSNDANDSKNSRAELVVPSSLVREISESNNLFFRDRQLFDPMSITFMKDILSLPPHDHDQTALKQLAQFNLEIMPRSVAGASDCHTALSTLVSHAAADLDLATWILKDFGTRLVLLTDFLLTCREKNIREVFAELIASCLEKVSAHDTPPQQTPPSYSEFPDDPCENEEFFNQMADPQTLCQEVVVVLLKLIDSSSRHWLRFYQLFSVILRWADSGAFARQFLISQATVARLGHLVLGRDTMLHHFPKHSTIMGNRIVQPDLHIVYNVMGLLVRSSYGVNMSRPASSLPGPLSLLSQEDLQIVNCELFYERALAMGGDVQGIVDILTHRSWENASHIAPINKMIIDGVIKATAEQVKPYFDLLHGIVQIPDSLQMPRIRDLMSPENGILYHLRSFSPGHPAFTFASIRLLLRSMEACEPFSSYMASMRHHCDWMIPWMQRYVEQHSYHLNNVASSPLSNRNQPLTSTSSSSCSAITEILRRHLRVPFTNANDGDDDRAISLSSSSDPDSPKNDALDDTHMPSDEQRNMGFEEVQTVRSKPLNEISGLEGEELQDFSDIDNNSEDDTSSVRSSGSVKKRRTGADSDRIEEDDNVESHPVLSTLNH